MSCIAGHIVEGLATSELAIYMGEYLNPFAHRKANTLRSFDLLGALELKHTMLICVLCLNTDMPYWANVNKY